MTESRLPPATEIRLLLAPNPGEEWRLLWRNGGFRLEALASAAGLVVILVAFTRFLQFVEGRPGVVVPDPLLAAFAPVDLTWIIFLIIYLGIAAGLFLLIRRPKQLVALVQAYCLLVLFRAVAMFLLPLEPPPGMLALQDPFVQYFGTGRMLTKDLFFSGHTATIFLIFLSQKGRWPGTVFLCATGILAVCLIAQHVHYTADIFVAPAFAYASYRLIVLAHRRPSSSPKVAR